MSRVEPKDDRRDVKREAEPDPRREPVEGDEETVDEALKRQH